MRRLLCITIAITLASCGVASAAGTGTAAITLMPSSPSAKSTASISVTGLPIGVPSSVEVLLQNGFSSSAASVSVLCSTSQASSNACPAASQIGTGSAGLSVLGLTATVPMTVFLGDPLQAGDIASVILIIAYGGYSVSVPGRLFAAPQVGLELLFSFNTSAAVILNTLAFSAGATRATTQTVSKTVTKVVTKTITIGRGRHRHKHKVTRRVKRKVTKRITTVESLFTNPSTCTGQWTGTLTATYSSGPDTLPVNVMCTA